MAWISQRNFTENTQVASTRTFPYPDKEIPGTGRSVEEFTLALRKEDATKNCDKPIFWEVNRDPYDPTQLNCVYHTMHTVVGCRIVQVLPLLAFDNYGESARSMTTGSIKHDLETEWIYDADLITYVSAQEYRHQALNERIARGMDSMGPDDSDFKDPDPPETVDLFASRLDYREWDPDQDPRETSASVLPATSSVFTAPLATHSTGDEVSVLSLDASAWTQLSASAKSVLPASDNSALTEASHILNISSLHIDNTEASDDDASTHGS
jgi:hypothetical protein